MSITVVCPECERKLKAPETAMGKAIRCPACKCSIPVGKASAPKRAARREEYEDDEPEIRKKRKSKGLSNGLLIGLIAGGGAFFLLLVGVGLGLYFYFSAGKSAIPEAMWQPFAPQDGGFTVVLPGTPSRLTSNNVKYEVNANGLLLRVTYSDLGPNPVSSHILHESIGQERDGIRKLFRDSQVISETPLGLGPLPGVELIVKIAKNEILIERLYLAKIDGKHRLFSLLADGDIQPGQGDAARFFDSFQVTATATKPDLSGGPASGMNFIPGNNPRQNPMPPGRSSPKGR